MDLSSKAIYDAFTDEIWEDLGPLDPNWFDVLTAEAFTNDGSEDQDDLCANQEGNFKTPHDKTAVESQLFSTPKVFRHSRIVSPEMEDDHSFTAEKEKETLPWTTTSPYLFRMSKERMPSARSHGVLPTEDSLDLLHTPQKSPQTVFAKRITESLGAQMNHDISWTSSLNTPPALPSTLILTRKEEDSSPLSLSSDKNVVIVRKLFPSLSNASRVKAVSPKNNVCTVQEDGVSLEAAQYPELNETLQTSVNQSDGVWKQKLPDAIEDEEVRSTVASVLDGAENALSIFFTNSSSALRKVKTERIKRRQIIPTKEDDSGSMDLQNSSASNEQRTADQEPGKVPLSPHVKKTANTEIVGSTQWSPLSLSEIPHISVDTSCHVDVTGKLSDTNILPEQPLSYSDSGKLVKQYLKMTDSGITKKKRCFVYTVKSSKLPQQEQEVHSENSASSPGIHINGQELNTVQIRNVPDEAKRWSINKNISEEKNLIQKCENVTEENLPPTAHLDMSQLCIAFAQDFSQMSDPVKRSSVAEDAVSNDFSPSACLSALKRAKQKTRQERLHRDCEDVSNNGLMSAINQNISISEGTISDSGFQSAVTEITHMTVSLSALPCSERDGQQKTNFQTQINKMCHFPPKNTGNGQVSISDSVQKAEMCAELPATVTECKTLGSDGESKLNSSKQLSSSAGGDGGRMNCLSSERTVSLPSALASGFKTASNKALHISSASLEKAKHLFDETGDERTLTDQPPICSGDIKNEFSISNGLKKDTTCNSNNPLSNGKLEDISCHLTASQKADVRELCSLLEEADSQFEFTQFKTTNLNQQCQDNGISSQKADKELDPDFLNGIDFDDSFSSDAEKSLPVKMTFDKYHTSDITSKPSDISLSVVMSKEKSSTGDTDFTSEGRESMMSFNVAGHDEMNKADNKSSSLFCEGFKTARGSVLKVSKTCLSKARALFADLEANSVIDKKLIDVPLRKSEQRCDVVLSTGQTELKLTSNDKHCAVASREVTGIRDDPAPNSLEFSKITTTASPSGFKMASGKGICISAKAMQEAKTLFKDCDLVDQKNGSLVKHITGSDKNIISKPKNVQGVKEIISEDLGKNKGSRIENVTDEHGGHHAETLHNDATEMYKAGCNHSPVLRHSNSLHGNPSAPAEPLSILMCPASGNTYSSAVEDWNKGNVFWTASGKKLCVSAAATEKAKSLLNEVDICEETNKQPIPKDSLSKTGNLPNHVERLPPQNSKFKTARGKGVLISPACLKKAKSLLSECDKPDDKSSLNQPYPKLTINGPLPRNRGFLAASGKSVAISTEALQKAKALFDDISFKAETPAASDTTDAMPEHGQTNTEKILKGFKTAGGAKVYLCDDGGTSTNSLQRADDCIKQLDVLHSSDNVSEKPPPAESGSAGETRMRNIERPQIKTFQQTAKGCNNSIGPVVTHERLQHNNDVEITNSSISTDAPTLHRQSFLPQSTGSGFCTASGKKVSVSDEAMTKAKLLLNENPTFEEISTKENALPPHNSSFKTASGKGVIISPAALNKAKCLLNECDETEDKSSMNRTHSKPTVNTLPPKNSGFQTAAGKRVTVSVSALQKAQSFLSEFNAVGDETSLKQTYPKVPVNDAPPRNNGFLSARGKPVAFSAEALQKAKALFDDMSFTTEMPAASDVKKNEEKLPNHTKKIQCGFTTAGGAKVHVPKKHLEKVKHLWKDFFDGQCPDSDSYVLGSSKSDPSKVKYLKETSSLVSAGEKDGPTEEIHPHEDESHWSLLEIDCANKVPQDPSISSTNKCNIPASMQDCEINPTSSSETQNVKAKHSSVVNIQSSVCNGYTETQQKFLAQEALDCTMALLEDEGLAGQSLTVNLENISLQNGPKTSVISVGAKKGTGKRAVEDADLTGQPPLKRQLLEEFDRTVNKPNRSALHPEKSCPYGVMNDRRVFKYSVSLHPNITKIPRSGKSHVETKLQKPTTQSVAEHTTPADSRSAHVKVSAFVPPFLNNTKTQTQKNNVHKDNRRTSSVFVPPFKKQRTVVQDSSVKPQKDEEQHNLVTVTPSDSNTCVLLANKTQSIMGVADNKSKEDIHTQGLPDSTNTNPTKCQHLLGSCGTEMSAEKASNVTDMSSRSQEIIQNFQNIELARDMQDMRIRKKKRQNIRPLPGSLFLTKTSRVSRITFTAAVNGKPPARYTQKQLYGHGVHQHVSEITSEAAEAFRFNLLQFLKQEAFIDGGGVQLADGGWLIPSNDGTAGKEEFYRALCDTPGVDPKLASEEWVYNHYRWIVWKLASMERSFPVMMGSLCLTPEQVLLQLKYRYDVEVDHSRRPALRKIMEKDDTAAKTLVLCVCGIVSGGRSPNKQSRTEPRTPQGVSAKPENSSAVLWLTDGWYAIKAQLDDPLTAMLHKGRLAVGGKLIIHGAQLVGSQDACSPLEAPESLILKIGANSSRPVRWDTKLGFHRDPRPFLLPISSLYSNGGPVGCVDIVILRSYPIQWMERKPDGGVVFRSERAEEKEARRYNSHKQKAMEMVFAKIQAEFENEGKGNMKPQRRRRTVSHQDLARLQDGEELHEALGDDAAYIEAHLSETQLETLQSYRRSLMEKKQAELQDRYRRALEAAEDSEGSCPKRDVTPVWRLSISDSMDQTGNSVYQLNLWQPSSDLQSLLKEGCRYKVYNLTTSDGKKRGGSSSVQLTATKKTQFQDVQASQEWLSARFQPRESVSFVDLQNPDFQPLCGEVDLTGFIISVIDEQGSSPAFYLADERLNFVKIRCFSSFAQSGVEDIVKPRVLLALSNLQLRGQSTFPTPVVYAGDLTVFSTNPKEVHLQKSLSHFRDCVQAQGNFFVTAEEKLSHMVTSDGFSAISSPALQPPTPAPTTEKRQDAKTNVTSQQPNRILGAFTPVSWKPAPPNSSAEKDPKSLKRRRALDYLSRIPSPPPLPHLSSGTTPCVKKTFNPPRRSGTPSTLKTVQTPAPKPPVLPVEDGWVNDEELAMIDTQKLCAGDLP
ncbi:breast cancer type 2 susceptibility protein [Sphaeramia orbicularis]|uniref:breast cancer type 2 susceptibility protein n=1 Tax=Sphaeramia orbicularis TaxID=375764 RepID=UPI00117DD26F|nr:breast cancer type 2 susceptibility protein [Sphaeramia orbicularis]